MSSTDLWPSINQSCFPDMDTQAFADCVAAAGFRSVELRTLGRTEDIGFIASAVLDHRLRVEAINGLMDWGLPDDPDPTQAVEGALRIAIAVDAPVIVCAAPIRAGELPPSEVVLTSASARFARMAAVTRDSGVRLALEQVGKSSTRPGASSGIRRLDDALAIVKHAGDDALLTLDSYNLATADERFDRLSRIRLSRIGIVQVAGMPADGSGRALPGEGEIDNVTFVRTLLAMGYAGPVSLEIFPARAWEDPGEFASRAFVCIHTLIATARAEN